jgi:antitoxin component YwqK of YwqJK toxin-antitoxin module
LYYESGELSGEMIFKNGKTMCSKDYNESGNEGSENK